jgi:hypothetical protein
MSEADILQEVSQATHCELEGKPNQDACSGSLAIYEYIPDRRWGDTLRCARHGAMLMEGWARKF